MGKKRRGREKLVTCDKCGARVPYDKAVSYYDRRSGRKIYLCIRCAKHYRVFEKIRSGKLPGARRPKSE